MAENDRDKLAALISYLIDHNREHAEELRELLGKYQDVAGENTVRLVGEAAALMDKSADSLSLSLADIKSGD